MVYLFDRSITVRFLFVRVIYPISMTRCFTGLFMNMNHMNSENYLNLFLSFNMLLDIEHRTSHLQSKDCDWAIPQPPSFLKNYKVSLKNRGVICLFWWPPLWRELVIFPLLLLLLDSTGGCQLDSTGGCQLAGIMAVFVWPLPTGVQNTH